MSAEIEPTELDDRVTQIIYEDPPKTKGELRASNLRKWSTDLANGRIPKGFETIEDFEQHILEAAGLINPREKGR